jgi:hypothetical protein
VVWPDWRRLKFIVANWPAEVINPEVEGAL